MYLQRSKRWYRSILIQQGPSLKPCTFFGYFSDCTLWIEPERFVGRKLCWLKNGSENQLDNFGRLPSGAKKTASDTKEAVQVALTMAIWTLSVFGGHACETDYVDINQSRKSHHAWTQPRYNHITSKGSSGGEIGFCRKNRTNPIVAFLALVGPINTHKSQ